MKKSLFGHYGNLYVVRELDFICSYYKRYITYKSLTINTEILYNCIIK